MNKIIYAVSVVVLLLAGCAASGPTISVNSAPGADLSEFRTWNFIQPLGTDRSNGTRTPLSTMLMNSVSSEMAARGLAQSDSPDMLVDFFVTTEERMDIRQTPNSSMSTMHRSNWHRGISTWPTYQTTVRQYTQGTLLIDLIDPANNVLLAEGAAQDRLRSGEITQQQANDVVGQIMAGMLSP
ncbi:MAG: DUF4136 domain-containing protein [Gammaproteobacteria bacterium]|jgi:hypothetical protein|nr:DUF4136 domain-containing protein [Gammaproteobacteria bacterium]